MTNLVSIIAAMHLAALAQIESGVDDAAVGSHGEVSRYQFMPALAFAAGEKYRELRDVRFDLGWERDDKITRRIALVLWRNHLINFQMRHQRSPTPVELYLLWHRPARVMEATPAEMELALRFAHLASVTLDPIK